MVRIQYFALTILVVFFAQDVNAVTDEQFQDLRSMLYTLKDENNELWSIVDDLKKENKDLTFLVINQKKEIKIQESIIIDLRNRVDLLSDIMTKTTSSVETDTKSNEYPIPDEEMMQNTTIEERVALLEIQVAVIQDEVADSEGDISILIENDNFLFDEQIIQDERLFSLEQENEEIEDTIVSLQANTLDLEVRVGNLEENSGDNGNSSIAELEIRVETLEDVTTDQETRIVTAEENIQGLQMTDVNHEARITALEENGGGGSNQNDTIAFYAVMAETPTIEFDTTVIFADVMINNGDGYDSSTGVFTVPPGGDGLYYFSAYILVQAGEDAQFNIVVNNVIACTVLGESDGSVEPQSSCSAVADVFEGDEIEVVYDAGTDTTPIGYSSNNVFTGFNGFKI